MQFEPEAVLVMCYTHMCVLGCICMNFSTVENMLVYVIIYAYQMSLYMIGQSGLYVTKRWACYDVMYFRGYLSFQCFPLGEY